MKCALGFLALLVLLGICHGASVSTTAQLRRNLQRLIKQLGSDSGGNSGNGSGNSGSGSGDGSTGGGNGGTGGGNGGTGGGNGGTGGGNGGTGGGNGGGESSGSGSGESSDLHKYGCEADCDPLHIISTYADVDRSRYICHKFYTYLAENFESPEAGFWTLFAKDQAAARHLGEHCGHIWDFFENFDAASNEQKDVMMCFAAEHDALIACSNTFSEISLVHLTEGNEGTEFFIAGHLSGMSYKGEWLLQACLNLFGESEAVDDTADEALDDAQCADKRSSIRSLIGQLKQLLARKK